MTNEQKAIKAMSKSQTKFPYLLMVNSRGAVISIFNQAARVPILGDSTNEYRCTLNIDSSMSVSKIAASIDKKWEIQ